MRMHIHTHKHTPSHTHKHAQTRTHTRTRRGVCVERGRRAAASQRCAHWSDPRSSRCVCTWRGAYSPWSVKPSVSVNRKDVRCCQGNWRTMCVYKRLCAIWPSSTRLCIRVHMCVYVCVFLCVCKGGGGGGFELAQRPSAHFGRQQGWLEKGSRHQASDIHHSKLLPHVFVV